MHNNLDFLTRSRAVDKQICPAKISYNRQITCYLLNNSEVVFSQPHSVVDHLIHRLPTFSTMPNSRVSVRLIIAQERQKREKRRA